jgi:hypothetical protein
MCSSETLFPGNEVAGIYHEIAKKVMIFSLLLGYLGTPFAVVLYIFFSFFKKR